MSPTPSLPLDEQRVESTPAGGGRGLPAARQRRAHRRNSLYTADGDPEGAGRAAQSPGRGQGRRRVRAATEGEAGDTGQRAGGVGRGGWWAEPMRWSGSGVVCLVARRHRSTASLRAAATASLLRTAHRSSPARMGGLVPEPAPPPSGSASGSSFATASRKTLAGRARIAMPSHRHAADAASFP